MKGTFKISESQYHTRSNRQTYSSKDGITFTMTNPSNKSSGTAQYNLIRAMQMISRVAAKTFLPIGYPNSVRKEYISYQVWDSIQGLCSYLRSVLTTRSILQGAGVGSPDKTALAAALVWIIKDGIGMLGSLVFAYLYADYFEVAVKEFRLLADFLNNCALVFSLLISIFPNQFLLLSCLSSLCGALCGLIAGAVKARISAHFARGNHLADITAKESTQETAVSLIGLILGYICATLIGDSVPITWTVFISLLLIHQYANYILIRTLILDTLNPQRCWILMRLSTIQDDEPIPLDPETVSRLETLSRPMWLAIFGPRLGASVTVLTDSIAYIANKNDPNILTINALFDVWKSEKFIIGFDCKGKMTICLAEEADEYAIVKAYFISLFLAHSANQPLYVMFNVSRPDLKRRYEDLIKQDAAMALKWFDGMFLSLASLREAGWDVGEDKARLGGLYWRYSSKGQRVE